MCVWVQVIYFMVVAWPGSGWQSSRIWQQGGTLIEARTQTKVLDLKKSVLNSLSRKEVFTNWCLKSHACSWGILNGVGLIVYVCSIQVLIYDGCWVWIWQSGWMAIMWQQGGTTQEHKNVLIATNLCFSLKKEVFGVGVWECLWGKLKQGVLIYDGCLAWIWTWLVWMDGDHHCCSKVGLIHRHKNIKKSLFLSQEVLRVGVWKCLWGILSKGVGLYMCAPSRLLLMMVCLAWIWLVLMDGWMAVWLVLMDGWRSSMWRQGGT